MNLGVDEVRPAVVAIDMHRGHLDPEVATLPLPADKAARVIAASKGLLDWARSRGIPVAHVVTKYRDEAEIRCNPFWRTRAENPSNTRKNVLRHNIAGMPGCTIIPELHDAGRDWVVDGKKSYDCFVATDLDYLLRSHAVNTLLVTGVNTNSCVLSTVVSACTKNYAVIVAEDCVETMDGPELHAAGLLCIKTAFGFVMSSREIMASNALRGA